MLSQYAGIFTIHMNHHFVTQYLNVFGKIMEVCKLVNKVLTSIHVPQIGVT